MTDFTYQEGTPLTWAQMNENLRLMQAKYLDASNNAAIAIAAANFKGNWSALTGALAVPASVYHAGGFWLLLSNLADVTAATPGVSGSWLQVNSGNVQGPVGGTDGHGAVFDGATGKLLKSLGAAPVKKSGDTMTGTLNVGSGGSVLVTGSGGLGYGVGSGGTVTQATSKSTAVTLNKPSGVITTHNASLGAGATVTFAVNNTLVAVGDGVVLTVGNATGATSYEVWCSFLSGTIFYVTLRNVSGGALAEAVFINFQVIKGATS